MRNREDLIWLTYERCFGWLLQRGAYVSLVEYTKGGMEFETWIENNEFELREEGPIDYDGD